MELNLFGGAYEYPSKPVSVQDTINLIPVVTEREALVPNLLTKMKGLEQFSTTGDNTGRGSHVMKKVPFFVNGKELFSMAEDGTVTNLGAIAGTEQVSMADNGSKLCIVVPGIAGYVYDGATLAQITDPDFQLADTVVYKDGFFIFTASDGLTFFISNLNDPLTFEALDFGTAEADPDSIVAAHVNHNELFILGKDTTELFQNVGTGGFPFVRVQGGLIQKGCAAPHAIVEFDNSFLFIGGGEYETAAIWRVESSQNAIKISTDAIDSEIQKFTEREIAEAWGFTFSFNGQFIAGFTFRSARIDDITFCYNTTSQRWFQIQTGIPANGWRVNSVVRAYDKYLCTDSIDGRIGELTEANTEYGDVIMRRRTTKPFINQGRSMEFPEIELLIESGVGLTGGDAPIVRMALSKDGGRTFGVERPTTFGKIGQYNKRAIWRKNGRVDLDVVMRFTVTDPVDVNFLGLMADVEQGYG